MASKQFMALAVLAVMLGCTTPLPTAQIRQQDQVRTNIIPPSQVPVFNNIVPSFKQASGVPQPVSNFLRNGVPSGAQLINVQPQLPAISARLPDNYTLIRPNTVDTFRCSGSEFPNGYRNYGYYADTDNECQIFHVCLPLQQLYPGNFTNPITYQFSFICPEFTVFTQDALVCQWTNEAVPCEYAEELYSVNNYFFTDKGLDGETYGKKIRSDNRPSSVQG
ncbi:unnamed protein product [Meganyctiphanes norvegica]|uniref:Chitin-binding type-2 domain-containing protein n=1 Tax=Meganyctiphanes norvegica TaxID=48144 RepID=A0AAV2PJI1_MEGNR